MRFRSTSDLSSEPLGELDDDATGAEGYPCSRDLGLSPCELLTAGSGTIVGCVDRDPGSSGREWSSALLSGGRNSIQLTRLKIFPTCFDVRALDIVGNIHFCGLFLPNHRMNRRCVLHFQLLKPF